MVHSFGAVYAMVHQMKALQSKEMRSGISKIEF